MSASKNADRRIDVAFGFALFFVALVPRLFVALRWAGEPVWDGHYYDFGARRIAGGFGYSDDSTIGGQLIWHPWCHYPVGYSAFLGGIYRILGSDLRVAAVANAVVGALVAVVTWLLANGGLSRRRARFAGLLVAFHPGLIVYAALVMTEPLSALLTLFAFWLPTRRHRSIRWLANDSGVAPGAAVIPAKNSGFGKISWLANDLGLAALTLGLAALVRPQALLCVPFLALVPKKPSPALAKFGRLWRIVPAVALCAVALVPVLPWTARNCAKMDGCALISTNAGWNLAIGSFPRATGRFETLRASDGCRDVTGQVQQDRCWFEYGVAQIKSHPMHWLALMPAKLGFTFDHESFPIEYLREARPSVWPEVDRVRGREVLTGFHRWLLCAAAFGGIAFAKRKGRSAQGLLFVIAATLILLCISANNPTFWPIALFACVLPCLPVNGRPTLSPALTLALALFGTTLATHAVFFGEDRYHMIATPVFCILAAAAFRKPADKTKRETPFDVRASQSP